MFPIWVRVPAAIHVMKTITKTVHVPAYDYEESVYQCEECPEEFESVYEHDDHYAERHAIADSKRLKMTDEKGGFYDSVYLRFESEAKYLAVINNHNATHFDRLYPRWEGPGWYMQETEEEVGNCRCGRCIDFLTSLVKRDPPI